MTYDVYRYIFIGAAILAGLLFVLAVVLFFLLKIPKVVSDLSGATARKAIKQIREQNEASGDKSHQVSAFNRARGRLTDKISPSGQLMRQHTGHMPGHNTTKIATQHLPQQEPAGETSQLAPETSVLAPETSVLAPEAAAPAPETSVLSPEMPAAGQTGKLDEAPAGQTGKLDEAPAGQTAVLSNQPAPASAPAAPAQPFLIEYEITYVHSDEEIR